MAADLKPAEMRAWAAFLDAQAALLRQLESELIEKEDMTLAEFDVLIQLGMAPDPRLRMTELSERVRLSRSGLTRLVDRLVQAGLVKRGKCAEDRRGTFAIFTTVGGARLHRARAGPARGPAGPLARRPGPFGQAPLRAPAVRAGRCPRAARASHAARGSGRRLTD